MTRVAGCAVGAMLMALGCGARTELRVWGVGADGSGASTGSGGDGGEGGELQCVEQTYDFVLADSYPAGHTPLQIATGDFDRDGDADLAVANDKPDDGYHPMLTVHLNEGDGSFAPPDAYHPELPFGQFAVASGDLDADGRLDLLAIQRGVSCINHWTGLGDGTFFINL